MSEYSGNDKRYDYLVRHNAIAWKHLETLHGIKLYIRLGLYDAAHEAWEELPQEDQVILNRAKSRGGFFEPFERQIAVKGMDSRTDWSYGNRRLPE